MSKGAKQALFVALAAVVIVAVMYTINSGKSTGNVPVSASAGQQSSQQQIDPTSAKRISDLEAKIRTNPKDVGSLTELGELYFNSGQLDKAPAAFSAALQIQPDNAELHNALGFAYFWTGKSSEAVAEYKQAISLDPKSAEPYYNLALALNHNTPSDLPGAIENWKKVIELSPPDSALAKKSQEYIDKYQTGTRQTTTAPSLKP